MAERKFPAVKVRRNVACQSARAAGADVDLIVLHSTEGANIKGLADLVGLGAFFDRIAVQASSHVAIDAEGNSARYVPDARKAWTQAGWNSRCVSVEMIGRAAQRSWTDAEVDEAARWLAYWSIKHHVPLHRARVTADGRVLSRGVITHKELGALGGGHVDPGDGFPVNRCIERARRFRRQQRAHFARQARS